MNVNFDKVKTVIEPILADLGYELIHLSFQNEQGRWVLRLFIDREGTSPVGGVTIGDCEKVSREIETPLEVEQAIPIPYRLEVSTPGLNRPLVKETDYVRFAGRKAAIETAEPLEGRRNFKGLLQGAEQDLVRMMIDGKEYRIPFKAIKKAHLVYEGGK